jgi:hypothetical protein
MEKKYISNFVQSLRIFLMYHYNMKWKLVKCFYIHMRQHMTFSIVTDGVCTFIRNIVKEVSSFKLNKDTPRVLTRKDATTSTKNC